MSLNISNSTSQSWTCIQADHMMGIFYGLEMRTTSRWSCTRSSSWTMSSESTAPLEERCTWSWSETPLFYHFPSIARFINTSATSTEQNYPSDLYVQVCRTRMVLTENKGFCVFWGVHYVRLWTYCVHYVSRKTGISCSYRCLCCTIVISPGYHHTWQ